MPEPILIGDPGGPELVYQVGPNETFQIEALSFTADLTGAAGPGDVSVEYRTPTGETIIGATPGVGLAVGTVALFTLAPHLNPCDSTANASLTLIPDTWPALVLTGSCFVDIFIVDPVTGSNLAGALVTGALLWATNLGSDAFPDQTPILVLQSADSIAPL